MQRRKVLLTLAAFLFAAAFSLVMATFVGGALESRSERHSQRALNNAGFDWVEASADGLLVTLTGTAPTEAMRFRAAKVVADTVGASRVIDRMEVTPARALTAPHFSLELLRNDDGVSIIGLVPAAWEGEDFVTAADGLSGQELTNMIDLMLSAWPERLLRVRLVQISADARAEEGRYGFRSRLEFAELPPEDLRPAMLEGMRGVVRLEAGRSSLLAGYTRGIRRWLQGALWRLS